MKNTKCWFFHTWGKWTDMQPPRQYEHNKQIKECQKCGIKKMRWYSDSYN